MQYRVLLPIDNDADRTIAQTRTAARLPGAAEDVAVTLMHVFGDEDRAESTSVRQLSSGKEAIEELRDRGIGVETTSRHGDPAAEILGVADQIDADLIVLGGRKRSKLGSLLFGSVTQAVILDADCPVTVTGVSTVDDPSHVCQSCGERYYTDAGVIHTCQSCGGTKVEAV